MAKIVNRDKNIVAVLVTEWTRGPTGIALNHVMLGVTKTPAN